MFQYCPCPLKISNVIANIGCRGESNKYVYYYSHDYDDKHIEESWP